MTVGRPAEGPPRRQRAQMTTAVPDRHCASTRSSSRCGAIGIPAVDARSAIATSSRDAVTGQANGTSGFRCRRTRRRPHRDAAARVRTPRPSVGLLVVGALTRAQHRDGIVDDAAQRSSDSARGAEQRERRQPGGRRVAGDDVRRSFGCDSRSREQVVAPSEDRRQTRAARNASRTRRTVLRLGAAPARRNCSASISRARNARSGSRAALAAATHASTSRLQRREIADREMREAGGARRLGDERGVAERFGAPDGLGRRRHRAAEVEAADGNPRPHGVKSDDRRGSSAGVAASASSARRPRRYCPRQKRHRASASASPTPAASPCRERPRPPPHSTLSASSSRARSIHAAPDSVASAIDGPSSGVRWQYVRARVEHRLGLARAASS